jgi:hypothetical protein
MQGSFEHPPIIVGIPKAKIGATFAIAAAVAILTVLVPQVPTFVEFPAWLFVLLSGGALATAPLLIISQEGLLRRSILGKDSWAWEDFDRFEVYQMPFLGITSPGCYFSQAYIRRTQPIPDPLTPADKGVIGALWEMPAPELVALLNEARERWAIPISRPSP